VNPRRLGVLCAALLAGCGGGGSGDAPTLAPAAVHEVPVRVREAGTFAFEAAYVRELPGEPHDRYLQLEGGADVAADAGWLRAELAALLAGLPEADTFEEPIELRWTRSELRARIDGHERSLPRAQARESGGLIGRLPDEPRALVELLAEAENVRRVETEVIGDRPTVRFACVVDARRAGAAGAPAELTEAFEQEVHGPTLPLDVWLDGNGLPRRIEYVVRLDPLVTRGRQILPERVVRATYDLDDFGEPVEPPG
jgi:hypothetical protein